MKKKFILEPAREIPVTREADVVVCGGGPSGFIAAIAAARNGAKTLLLEHYGFLGGMATAGLVGPISKFNFRGERIISGIPEEFVGEMAGRGGAIIDLQSGNVPYDPETYKYTALNMVEAAGVDILLHAHVVGCVTDPCQAGTLTHVLIENKSGRQAIAAKYFIDCTGTGDLVSRSQLPWKMRNKYDGELQPMSLYFRLGGVDTTAFDLLMAQDGVKYTNVALKRLLMEEVDAGRLTNFGGPWAVHGSTLRDGQLSVNATRFRGNAADGDDVSTAERSLREDVMRIVKIFTEKVPAMRDAYLIDTATQVGIRETRGIIGLYTMTLEDILQSKGFDDTVAYGGHPVDIHRAANSKQDVSFLQEPYAIPYRSLVPKGATNLLVAGGCLSATREAFASIRVQAQCMALGQAAGTAAALCARAGIGVAELNGKSLREELKGQGAIV
ncbi:FAD-dependent oxidoreductase [Parapedobacter tibetensis]|uniref:FAD-dependent oxidoreductase n=1 Tax=Parapedobacter tibetensis TaxID=2972951 RepID=UPI00214D2306|nr:FAD-dependent oxidoreductase [Parapedobacter tibetensis]